MKPLDIVILGLSIGLALTMLVANQAVRQKITSVKSSVGNTVSISPAGVRGFEGGGTALTTEQRSAVMRRVRGRDTAPEKAVRQIIRF